MRTILSRLALLAAGVLIGWLAFARLPLQAQEPKTADPHGWLGTETIKTRFGAFEFKGGYPTPKTAEALREQQTFNRAAELYYAMIPTVAMAEQMNGLRDFG